MSNEKMTDFTASVLVAGGIGTMLFIAGLPLMITVGIGAFTAGSLIGIQVAKSKM